MGRGAWLKTAQLSLMRVSGNSPKWPRSIANTRMERCMNSNKRGSLCSPPLPDGEREQKRSSVIFAVFALIASGARLELVKKIHRASQVRDHDRTAHDQPDAKHFEEFLAADTGL